MTGCQEERVGGFDHPLGEQLAQQVEASCRKGMTYHKAVYEEGAPDLQEDSAFQPVPQVPFGETETGQDSTNYLLLRDLNYALARYYRDTYIRELMQVQRSGDTTIAQVRPEQAEKAELQTQKVVMSPDSARLRYLETRLDKRSWLYHMRVRLAVQFDSAGRYQTHQLDVQTEVPLLDKSLSTRVTGTGQY